MVDELHSADFVDCDSAGRPADREGFKQGIRELYVAFPDFHATADDIVVSEASQKVAIRWSATGTHLGTFMVVPATGRAIRFRGIEIIHVEAGRIRERWGEWDGLDLMQQLKAPV